MQEPRRMPQLRQQHAAVAVKQRRRMPKQKALMTKIRSTLMSRIMALTSRNRRATRVTRQNVQNVQSHRRRRAALAANSQKKHSENAAVGGKEDESEYTYSYTGVTDSDADAEPEEPQGSGKHESNPPSRTPITPADCEESAGEKTEY